MIISTQSTSQHCKIFKTLQRPELKWHKLLTDCRPAYQINFSSHQRVKCRKSFSYNLNKNFWNGDTALKRSASSVTGAKQQPNEAWRLQFIALKIKELPWFHESPPHTSTQIESSYSRYWRVFSKKMSPNIAKYSLPIWLQILRCSLWQFCMR